MKVKTYLETFEEENKSIQNQMLDEKLSKEEAIKQLEAIKESIKQSDRLNIDKKNLQVNNLKKLETENDKKD